MKPPPHPFVLCGLLLLSACAGLGGYDLVDEPQLRADIAWLADDARMGREAGGNSEPAIREYAISRMQNIGLSPAFSDRDGATWLQQMNMAYRSPLSSKASFRRNGQQLIFPDDHFYFVGETASSTLNRTPIYFLGKSDPALISPEILAGRLILMLEPQNSSIHAERIAALRTAGAAGIVTILDDRQHFQDVTHRMKEPGFFLPGGNPLGSMGAEKEFITAVMTEQAVVQLATFAGTDWDTLFKDARASDYTGTKLSISVNLDWRADIELRETANIAGLSKGKASESGALLFLAHWDHLGLCEHDSDHMPAICPGAVDNASGIAALWQIAQQLAEIPHDRDIYFLLTTGEEDGFIGANKFIAEPPLPLSDLVAIFNLDMLAIGKGSSNAAIIGWQDNLVDRHIENVLADLKLKRVQSGSFTTYLKRQDGWPFLQKGLPARMVSTSFGNEQALKNFIATQYHAPADRYSPTMELGAAAQNISLHVALARHFASRETFSRPQ